MGEGRQKAKESRVVPHPKLNPGCATDPVHQRRRRRRPMRRASHEIHYRKIISSAPAVQRQRAYASLLLAHALLDRAIYLRVLYLRNLRRRRCCSVVVATIRMQPRIFPAEFETRSDRNIRSGP